jgi:HTH-type transcriptional regulator, competence development regulator
VGKEFGAYLRDLRKKTDLGLKRVAPALGLSYSYLSKLENGLVEPSSDTVNRLAAYYHVDSEVLATAAGQLPADVAQILAEQPEAAIKLLRQRFGH